MPPMVVSRVFSAVSASQVAAQLTGFEFLFGHLAADGLQKQQTGLERVQADVCVPVRGVSGGKVRLPPKRGGDVLQDDVAGVQPPM